VNVVTTIALGILGLAGLLAVARLARPGSLADRVIALDVLVVVVVSAIGVYSVRIGEGVYLELLVVAGLLGFVATITVARFMERRGT
jgi:multicomponent Na+:H+ antiporter subunit F